MSKKKSYTKLQELNFNLKNEIICFIPVDQIFNTISFLDKSFANALSKRKIIKIIMQNIREIEYEIYFSDENINEILSLFIETGESTIMQYQLCAYLILLKYKYIKRWEFCSRSDIKNYQVIAFHLAMNKNIAEVEFYQTGIWKLEENFRSLFSVGFRQCENLTSISLIEEKLGQTELSILLFSKSLENNHMLKNIDLTGNLIGRYKNNLFHLTEIIKTNQSLSNINLSSNYLFETLDKQYLELFCDEIANHQSLSVLNISNNLLGENEDFFCFLVKTFENNKNLKLINLDNNNIGKFVGNICAIVNLIKNKNLRNIFLNSNALGKQELNDEILQLIIAIETNLNIA